MLPRLWKTQRRCEKGRKGRRKK